MSGRRANGEGSVRKRADGRYEARYTGADGKSHSLYGRKRAEVAQRLRDATRDAERGIRPTTRRDTVGELLTDWLATKESRVRPSTWAQYESYTRTHLITALGAIEASKLTPDDVERMLTAKLPSLSPRTVAHLRAILRNALAGALKKQKLAWNVAAIAEGPRLEQSPILALDAAGSRKFFAATSTAPHGALYTVALIYGLRLGECLGLRWSDIGADSLSVSQAYQRVRGRAMFVAPKSAMSRRTLPRFESAEPALAAQRAKIAGMRLKAGSRWQDLDLVFPNRTGGPQSPSSTTRTLRATLASLGLPELTFHALRHSCASIHNELGTDPRTIQTLLGHTSPAVTLRVYTHITAGQMRIAAGRMDALFADPSVDPNISRFSASG